VVFVRLSSVYSTKLPIQSRIIFSTSNWFC